jgi:hypothetical protein
MPKDNMASDRIHFRDWDPLTSLQLKQQEPHTYPFAQACRRHEGGVVGASLPEALKKGAKVQCFWYNKNIIAKPKMLA